MQHKAGQRVSFLSFWTQLLSVSSELHWLQTPEEQDQQSEDLTDRAKQWNGFDLALIICWDWLDYIYM